MSFIPSTPMSAAPLPLPRPRPRPRQGRRHTASLISTLSSVFVLGLTYMDRRRYSSPVIPLRVGQPPRIETFYVSAAVYTHPRPGGLDSPPALQVHKHILLKSEYFERALCGDFREAAAQSINLPEEDPAIFHFVVAYLYEGRYDPIKPIASALTPESADKGKSRDLSEATGDDVSDTEHDAALSSNGSDPARNLRRLRQQRANRERRAAGGPAFSDQHLQPYNPRQKHPGFHRPSCSCPQCTTSSAGVGSRCWNCGATRAYSHAQNPAMMPPTPMYNTYYNAHMDEIRPAGFQPLRRPGAARPRRGDISPPGRAASPPPPPAPAAPVAANLPHLRDPRVSRVDPHRPRSQISIHGSTGEDRVWGEDLRTWLLAYELNLDVYILANKYLLDGLKHAVTRAVVDMLEAAGGDAALVPEMLFLCKKLWEGLPEADALLKMVFARVGFLQPWRYAMAGGADGGAKDMDHFLVQHPEIAALLLRELAARREEDVVPGRGLPSMERAWAPIGAVAAGGAAGRAYTPAQTHHGPNVPQYPTVNAWGPMWPNYPNGPAAGARTGAGPYVWGRAG